MVKWLGPQFDALNGTLDVSAYTDVSAKWMVDCMAPDIEAYMGAIPISTFMGLQSCDFSGQGARMTHPHSTLLDTPLTPSPLNTRETRREEGVHGPGRGYMEQYPELSAFDMSAMSATDFITAMPPGMMMRILQAQREM